MAIEVLHVTRSDGTTGRYVLDDERPDGSIVLRPDTSYEAMAERAGGRRATTAEFDELFGELPTDDEG